MPHLRHAKEAVAELEGIVADGAFKQRFGDSAHTFREMVANGGTNHVFKTLRQQALTSNRAQLLVTGLNEAAAQLQQIILHPKP